MLLFYHNYLFIFDVGKPKCIGKNKENYELHYVGGNVSKQMHVDSYELVHVGFFASHISLRVTFKCV